MEENETKLILWQSWKTVS